MNVTTEMVDLELDDLDLSAPDQPEPSSAAPPSDAASEPRRATINQNQHSKQIIKCLGIGIGIFIAGLDVGAALYFGIQSLQRSK